MICGLLLRIYENSLLRVFKHPGLANDLNRRRVDQNLDIGFGAIKLLPGFPFLEFYSNKFAALTWSLLSKCRTFVGFLLGHLSSSLPALREPVPFVG